MQVFKKIIFGIILAWLIFSPAAGVRAASAALAPELNPICWEQKACEKARTTLGGGAGKEGWLENQEPCNKKEWGMCLPAGSTITEISFGGEKKFANIGVFILNIYKYAVGVASILATIMIIISGAQWATSGGNTETITNARKRIAGAVIGLFIALMSNFILSSINPALVSLRLPQTYLIRSMVLGSEFCADMSSSSQFAFAAAMGATVDKNKLKDQQNWRTLDKISVSEKQCGTQWFIKDGGGVSCVTSVCTAGSSGSPVNCIPSGVKTKPYDCLEGNIFGTAYDSSPIDAKFLCASASGWKKPWVDISETGGGIGSSLQCACNEGRIFTGARSFRIDPSPKYDENTKKTVFVYKIPSATLDSLVDGCKTLGGFKGCALYPVLTSDCRSANKYHLIGKSGNYLGNVAPSDVDASSLISIDDLKKGIKINIDLGKITE
jgi:hypothetical protein